MTKSAFRGWPARGGTRRITKTLLVMKFTVFLLTAAFLQVSASGLSQSITFSGKRVSLQHIFSVVEQQTGYYFMYPAGTLAGAKAVTIQAKDQPLRAFLDAVFAGQSLQYSISSKTINVSMAKPGPAPTVPATAVATGPVKGIVRNTKGDAVAGANIMIKGSSKGVAAAADGSFTIQAKAGDVLVVTSVGYKPHEYRLPMTAVPGQLLITLTPTDSKLDEVQVIAYGKTTQRYSTGNITTVKSDVIERQAVNNPLLALQGHVPGLVIQQASGFAGSGVKVQIQGLNSIHNGSNPFFVVDGVPFPGQTMQTMGGRFWAFLTIIIF